MEWWQNWSLNWHTVELQRPLLTSVTKRKLYNGPITTSSVRGNCDFFQPYFLLFVHCVWMRGIFEPFFSQLLCSNIYIWCLQLNISTSLSALKSPHLNITRRKKWPTPLTMLSKDLLNFFYSISVDIARIINELSSNTSVSVSVLIS